MRKDQRISRAHTRAAGRYLPNVPDVPTLLSVIKSSRNHEQASIVVSFSNCAKRGITTRQQKCALREHQSVSLSGLIVGRQCSHSRSLSAIKRVVIRVVRGMVEDVHCLSRSSLIRIVFHKRAR